ncbi:VirB4 family type IV secretion system protein [Ramlibacter sp. AN1133]|uniref:VirB4 family type IV secretion system protein n=1 Tax=Ramlibacter sp. AN1133 TaxID=3133429 RepID=UPI0030C170E2
MLSFQDLFTKPRRAARSYAELLPWFGVTAPGLVLCQDGSLLAGFAYEGEDVEGKEDFAADQGIDLLQMAFRTLNDRCTLWTVQERRFTAGYLKNEFSNPVARLIDAQWERACSERRNARLTQRLFIAYNFPNRSEAFFEAVRAELAENDGRVQKSLSGLMKRRLSEKGAIARVRGQLAQMAHEFEKVIGAFSGIVERSLGFRRLLDGEFLGELYARANLASPAGPVSPPAHLAYLNTTLASDTLERQHDLLRFKGPAKTLYAAALSTTGTPSEAHAQYVDQLMGLDCEYVLVQAFRFLDRLPAEKAIQDAEMFYRAEVKSVTTRVAERLFDVQSDKVNTGNLHLAQDAQDALVELTAGDVAYGYYNMTLLALGDSPRQAQAAVDLLGSSLRANGFTIVRERHGLMSALLGTFPGNAHATLRWRLASTANLADLAPIRTISRGEPTHPLFSRVLGYEVPPLCRFLTPYGVAFDFNPHEDDLGHTAIIGGSGSGKTSLMTLLIAQFRKYNPSRAYVFDKDYSLMMATVLLGGRHIDMSRRGLARPRLNPVRVMLRNGDEGRLRQWLEVLIGADGHQVSGSESTALNTAIQQLRRSHEANWKLSALYALIAGQDQHLANKLTPYVDQSEGEGGYGTVGSHASYFDHHEDDFDLSTLVAMECGGLLDDRKVASPFMDYAFYCIERSLDGSSPTLIYLEEAWYMLSNAAFAEKMQDWLRTLRKKRAFVVFATQALDEIARLPNIGSFVANIPTQIFLPSVKSSVHGQADLYRQVFGTTDAQIALLAQAIPKRDYLLVRPTLTRLVNTRMPPALVAINEATVQEGKRARLREYEAAGGPDWELRFLREVLDVKT